MGKFNRREIYTLPLGILNYVQPTPTPPNINNIRKKDAIIC